MRESGRRIKPMERESLSAFVDNCMRENGKMTYHLGVEDSY